MPKLNCSAAEYRAEAARLRREADVAQLDGVRQALLSVALAYEALADSTDVLNRSWGAIR
jgi:hypothetical protein